MRRCRRCHADLDLEPVVVTVQAADAARGDWCWRCVSQPLISAIRAAAERDQADAEAVVRLLRTLPVDDLAPQTGD